MEETKSRYDRLIEIEPFLARKIKTLIEEYLGPGEVAGVGFGNEMLGAGYLTIGVDFYDEPRDGEKSPDLTKNIP